MLNETAEEKKLFAWAAPVILPIIERRKEVTFLLLMAAFKQGQTENTALIAELAVLTDLIREIKTKQQEFNQQGEENV